MKVGIITFHASHNYGSMLQAYALQQTVIALGHECEIINLRTKAQKNMYKPFYRQHGWIKKAKAIRYPFLTIDDIKKHSLFENFLNHKLILSSATFSSVKELEGAQLDYDCYISGSDQIWNTWCTDFSTAYYLDFVKTGKRIAYAPSMGPKPCRNDEAFKIFISKCLSRYDSISVREPDTSKRIQQISGRYASVVADPTLLLLPSAWSTLAGETPLVKGEYILLYTPWYESYRDLYVQATKTAKQNGIRVICTTPEGYRAWHNEDNFDYYTAVGPIEFVNLIKFSRGAMCGSFHGVVFSLLFNKPFYAYKGMEDSRISHLLELTSLQKCAYSPVFDLSHEFTYDCDKLRSFIETSRQFLQDSLK